MRKVLSRLMVAASLTAPLVANAVVYQFNASLNGANEIGTLSNATATGVATLFYDNLNTASLLDDTYSFSMSVFGLSGGTPGSGKAANAFHIHGAATAAENGPVRVALDNPALFTSLNSGSILLVGGSGLAVPTIAATAAGPFNVGYPAMSFLDMLQGSLAYVNVHTAMHPAGAVRGQLLQVAVVPEPETYALMLAGLGLVGALARRRKRAA